MTAYVSFVCKKRLAWRTYAVYPYQLTAQDSYTIKYDLHNNIAIVSLDDGKANVVGHNFLDEVVATLALDARALAVAEKLAQLPQKQYAANKLFLRKKVLDAMSESLDKLMVQA